MRSLCIVCQKAKVPNYFLIQCISCNTFWHHRCHSPPIPDSELIAIIRAFNDARARNSDATLNWKCGACRKVKPIPVDPVPKPRAVTTKDDPIVVEDDDDELEIIHPPVARQESTRVVASHSNKFPSAKIAQTVRIIDDPIHFLLSPSVTRPSSHAQRSASSTTLSSEMGHLSVSENERGVKQPTPPNSTDLEPRASAPSPLQAQLKSSENQQSSLPSSRARSRSTQRGSAVQPSSPTVAPALAPPSLGLLGASRIIPGTKAYTLLERWRWSMATIQLPRSNPTPPSRDPAPPFHPALLPHYINSQYRNITNENESGKKTDAWYLTALGKSKVKAAAPDQGEPGQSTGATAAPDPSHSRRSRSRAMHHQANHEMEPPPPHAESVSKVPFYFSANTWMKQNEDALTLFEATASK